MMGKNAYITPETEWHPLECHKPILQFSGGDKNASIVIETNGDESDKSNRTNSFNSNLWEETE